MSIPKMIDKRQAWLDGVSVEAMAVVSKLTKRTKAGITLSDREDMMLELCSGYLYMLTLCKEEGLFDSDDPFNLFNKETIH
jgi:hypothetical protein|tara:strand:- start:4606 stop:4848 length:243 start_codon:yes stop_codon:yes gene_type:complete